MTEYSLKGFSDWCEDYSMEARRDEARALKLPIVETDYEVRQAPHRRGDTGATCFIPMPRLTVSQIERAFFAPRRMSGDAEDPWMFDLLLLLPKRRHLGFRFEPADTCEDGHHGYSHVQLSWRFGHRCVTLADPLKWLPDSYPAFPVPGKGSLERFLMLVVALHGFPGGTKELLRGLNPGRPAQVREFVERVQSLLGIEDGG